MGDKNRSHPVFEFPEPDLFLDIGPGRPKTEAWKARQAWPNCKIVGVEACYKRFKTLAKRRDFPGDLIHKAVDEKIGILAGFVESKQNMFVKVPDTGLCTTEAVTIPAITLDSLYEEYAPNYNKSAFIWADIEGMELLMLKGATKLLASGNVVGLCLELWPRNAINIWPSYTGSRCTADQVVRFLANCGFCYHSVPEIRRHSTVFTCEENDPTFEKKIWFGDWLFTPEDFDVESLYGR